MSLHPWETRLIKHAAIPVPLQCLCLPVGALGLQWLSCHKWGLQRCATTPGFPRLLGNRIQVFTLAWQAVGQRNRFFILYSYSSKTQISYWANVPPLIIQGSSQMPEECPQALHGQARVPRATPARNPICCRSQSAAATSSTHPVLSSPSSSSAPIPCFHMSPLWYLSERETVWNCVSTALSS